MKQYLLPILFIITQAACGQTRMPNIEAAYSAFEKDPVLKYGLSSLTVLNAKTGEVVFSRNGDIGLAPASTLKTITALTAYHIVGTDFKWETTLGYSGQVANGTLNGDLIIKGGGDPTLGSDRYDQSKPDMLLSRWVETLKKAGIKKINGRVIGDDSLFGTQITPLGWIWQDIGNYYGAGATSLSWKENQIGLTFQPGPKPGDKASLLRVSDRSVPLKLVNEVITGPSGSGDEVYAYSAPYTNIVYLRGSYGIDLKKTIMIAMPDPALSLVSDLKQSFDKAGITVLGAATTSRILGFEDKRHGGASVILDTYRSPELGKVVYWLNQKSINLYAENIFKTIAWKQGNEPTTENGIKEVQKFWNTKLKIDQRAISILDGSGLSPENRVTTLAMATILQSAINEPWYRSFYDSLPLFNSMKMKSGSIKNVLAYAGYHKSESGNQYVFAFTTNNYGGPVKQKMFKVLDELK